MVKIGVEDTHLIIIMDWVRHKKLDKIIWHNALERKCSPQAGAILKRKGVRAGIFDIFVARPMNYFAGFWIELKVGKGRLSPNQIEFGDLMRQEGYRVDVAWSSDEAILLICDYLNIQR